MLLPYAAEVHASARPTRDRSPDPCALDRRILARAARKADDAAPRFEEALRALREAVEECIPDGRIFLLGDTRFGPIFGSLVTGVGIMPGRGRILVVRARRDGRRSILGEFAA